MKQNNSPRNGQPGALRPVLEMLEQRLLLDNGLGDILANQPAVIELSVGGDRSHNTGIISSDKYYLLLESEPLELNDAESHLTQAKDADQPPITLEDLFLNFEHVIGPLPDAIDDLTSTTPSDNVPDRISLEVQQSVYDSQDQSPLSPIEQTVSADSTPSARPELSQERAWSPLDAPLVIQMPAPAGLLAAELPSRLPDSTISKPLIAHSRSSAIAVTSTKALPGDVLRLSTPWLSPSAVSEISREAYFDPRASLKRAPMTWSTIDSASATRKHAALESDSSELRAVSQDDTAPKPTNNPELAAHAILLKPTLGYFNALVTNTVIATRRVSDLLSHEVATAQVDGAKNSELEPQVMANSLLGELNSQITVSQSDSLPEAQTAPSWSELLVLIVAGLLLPAYMQEPRVRNV